MGVVLLIAFSPWTVDTRRRMVRGAIVVGAAVGGYATLRWAIGPAGAEEELAAAIPNNFLDGDLRPVGSFVTTKELSAWTATMMPFALTFAFTERGHWRLMALAAFCLCAMGMLASDVRAGPAAAAPAVVVVVLLYQCSQAYRGRRGPTAMIVVLIMACAGAGAFTITLADKRDTKNRYENILHPERDESYQARLVKWRAALDDIDEVPFGYGLGTAGRSQERYGTTNNIGSYNLDNSYLKVAYEQGFVVMVLLVAIFLGLFAMLATGAVSLSDPARAGPAIAAAGTLVTMLALFYIGLYIEGLPALAGWILVGLGAGQLTRPA
jgi:hypothetical protein